LGEQGEADAEKAEEEVGSGRDLKGGRFILHGCLSSVAILVVDN
jgi:hypothetical protein